MSDIKSRDLAVALATRIATITVANGFNTDIGVLVLRGRVTMVPAEMPYVIIVEGEDTPQETKNKVKCRLRQSYVFEGWQQLAEGDVPNPNDICHLIVADLKKAIFGGDLTFGGLIGADKLEYVGRFFGVREDGTAVISASIEIAITYVEDLSSP